MARTVIQKMLNPVSLLPPAAWLKLKLIFFIFSSVVSDPASPGLSCPHRRARAVTLRTALKAAATQWRNFTFAQAQWPACHRGIGKGTAGRRPDSTGKERRKSPFSAPGCLLRQDQHWKMFSSSEERHSDLRKRKAFRRAPSIGSEAPNVLSCAERSRAGRRHHTALR